MKPSIRARFCSSLLVCVSLGCGGGDGNESTDGGSTSAGSSASSNPGSGPGTSSGSTDNPTGTSTGAACPVPDQDGDGEPALECGGDDCDDSDPEVFPWAKEKNWTIEVVASGPAVLGELDLALDAAGNPHITYFDGAKLMLATRAGQGFAAVEIATVADPEDGTAELDVDGDGHVHIAWKGAANELLYGTDATGTFVTEVLAAEGGAEATVVVTPAGDVHVSDARRYLLRQGGGAFVELWPHTGSVLDLDLAVDTAGNAHLVYRQDYGLRYVTNASGMFVEDTLVAAGGATGNGFEARAALDSDDVLHASARSHYKDASDHQLYYLTSEDGWNVHQVRFFGHGYGTPVGSDLVIDAEGAPHAFVHQHESGVQIEHLFPAGAIDDAWTREPVDTNLELAAANHWPRAAVGPDGTLHVAYVAAAEHEVRYATRTGPDGVDSNCDGAD